MCWAVAKSKTLRKQVAVTSGTDECVKELKLCLSDCRAQVYKQRPVFWSEIWKRASTGGLCPLWQWWMDRRSGVNVVLRGRLAWQPGEHRWCKPVILSITRCQLPPSPNTHTHTRTDDYISKIKPPLLLLSSVWPASYHWANRLTHSDDSDSKWTTLNSLTVEQ